MRVVNCDLVFVQGKGLDDLIELLKANPRYVFTLEKRKRTDVIDALKKHEIGYHSNWHSTQPTPAMYCSNLDWDVDGGREGHALWRHKQQVTHRGDVKLFQSGGKFWGQIRDHSNGMLTGAFLGWIVRNASDLIYRIEFWLALRARELVT